MAVIHEDRRTVSFKIVYCGTPIGGKTTNLQHIHKCLDPASRGELVSLSTAADRTLFFDFLAVEAPIMDGYTAKFQLYTVPGQVAYNATYQLVMRQADGLVFVADSQLDRMADNLKSWEIFHANLRGNGQSLERVPLVLQYNKRDLPNAAPVEYLDYLLNNGERRHYSFEANAARGHNVLTTLNAISHEVLTRFSQCMTENTYEGEQQNSPAVTAEQMSGDETDSFMARRRAMLARRTDSAAR
ncbi:GTPase domain-containing protein [Roseimicrobium sp. ORNL1]|uniref:GTP-binding protein n=1 Tax=Roseimicrobium sp. ORNL1 TaxID=2711231 RepID=UPI0013E204BD|nr:GTPase domain-containing protein [Roseimicrobium sp. ORNL1]QIF05313.1 GTPase domain-containing protein [Roseimicrobium sp. ORNL1]